MNADQNNLSHCSSPYLLQHKTNPVWWQPWGEDAFAAARRLNRPIFLSVGYSTCHWCHVMEKDSFEHQEVADALNGKFICIKLDREERPDVDQLYMSAVLAMQGHGGWPMSVFVTPDGKPFWAGTFLPREGLIRLANQLTELWKTNQKEIVESGDQVMEHLKKAEHLPQAGDPGSMTAVAEKLYASWMRRFDEVHGGYKGAPKFPPHLVLSCLLTAQKFSKNSDILHSVEVTLQQLRRGGIFDQVGMGFHRYSVDDHWLVPHFEKMLYDNALLLQAYAEAFQVTENEEYARVCRDVFEYLNRDMTSPGGAFYSAEDADSENIEGKFYVFNEEELRSLLTADELEEVVKIFGITPEGNFHAHITGQEVDPAARAGPPALSGNIFFLQPEFLLSELDEPLIAKALRKIHGARSKRVRPHLDDKVLLSWNALVIKALAKSFQALQNSQMLSAAQKAAGFILAKMRKSNGELYRTARGDQAQHEALCEDYATFISALVELYQCDFDEKWLTEALKLQEIQNRIFWDDKHGGYFDHSGRDPHLPTRAKTFEDNVTPSPNGLSAQNLLVLSVVSGNYDWRRMADKLLRLGALYLERYPASVPSLIKALALSENFEQWVIAGSADVSRLQKEFHPERFLARTNGDSEIPLLKGKSPSSNGAFLYACKDGVCLKPQAF